MADAEPAAVSWRRLTIACRRRARALLPILVLLAALIAGPSLAAAATAQALLTGARTSNDGDNARVEIGLSARVPYRVFSLPDPPRVVIDIDDVRFDAAATRAKAAGPIAAVRIGRLKPGTARLVVDLAQPAKIAGTRMSAKAGGQGHMLTIEIAGRPGRVAAKPLGADGRLGRQTVGEIGRAADGERVATAATTSAAAGSAQAVGRTAATAGDRHRGRQRVVVIDPGHGGVDPGAIGRRGLYEKHVTLAAAREIRAQLAELGSYRVVLTRNRDVFIPLRQRVAIARRADADLLLSVHADKLDNSAVRGLSVYTLSERASDAEAAALAERENKADLLADIDLRGAAADVTTILIALAQRDTMNQSAKLATTLVANARGDVALLPKAHRFAGFAVLKAPDVPSVLIELGFLSNADDEAMLRSAAGRRKLARTIARGVDAYFTSVEVANRR